MAFRALLTGTEGSSLSFLQAPGTTLWFSSSASAKAEGRYTSDAFSLRKLCTQSAASVSVATLSGSRAMLEWKIRSLLAKFQMRFQLYALPLTACS